MNGDWLALGAVAALAAVGVTRRGSADQPTSDKVVTRAGFPWPPKTVLYHGTYAMQAIKRQGFRTRRGGAPSMTGGGHDKSVSTTLLPERAAAIALGLDTMARVAHRKISLVELVYKLEGELGTGSNGEPLMVDVLTALADWVRGLGAGKPYEIETYHNIIGGLSMLDKGWHYVHLSDPPKIGRPYRVPRGSIDLRGNVYLVPPGSSLPITDQDLRAEAQRQAPNNSDRYSWIWKRKQGYVHGRCDAAFRIYSGAIGFGGMSSQRTFNPNFIGTNVAALASVPLSSIGMAEITTKIPRVCVDQKGAIRLGYVGIDDPYRRDVLDGIYRNCDNALDERDSWGDVSYADAPIFSASRSPWAKEPSRWEGWAVEQQDTRTSESTMLYYDGEEEVRIFDPRQISVHRLVSMPEIRRRFKLGNRLTFPWFDAGRENIAVWGAK